jgi:hypothetical protein
MDVMDRAPDTRRTAPLVLELLEPPRGLGVPADELEELILAAGDRLELEGDPDRRARLQRGRGALERELGRIIALG